MIRDAVATIPDDPKALREALLTVIAERDSRIAQLTAERDEALRQLRLHLSKRFGPRIEKLSPGQLSLFGDEVKAIDRSSQAEAETVQVPGHARRKPGPKPIPEDLPREIIEHHVPDDQCACPNCSKPRPFVNWLQKEQIRIIPARIVVVRHMIAVHACPECPGNTIKAPGPSLVLPNGRADSSLVAMVAVSKFADHAPLYRQEGMLARSGIDLARSTMCGWMCVGGELLVPLIEVIRSRVRQSLIIQSDDTVLPTLGLVKGSAKQARLWNYLGDMRNRYAVFEFTRSREGRHPQEWLKEFKGYLQTDEFAGYESVCAPGGATDVSCWAHARRKFHDARTAAPEFCVRVNDAIAKLYAVESAATRDELDPEQRRERREEFARPQLDVVFTMLEAARNDYLPKSPVRQAIEYVLTRRASFSRYIEHGEIKIDNNDCERCMRAPAIGRKNWLFAGSADGGETIARWMTIVQSARLHEVEPFAYIADILDRLAEFRDLPDDRKAAEREARIAELLPDVWIKAHPEAGLPLGR